MAATDPPRDDNSEIGRRRQRAVKTAKLIALVAVVIYIGFILTGIYGR